MNNTILIRHLEDQEDLRQPDRDCPIKDTEVKYVPQMAEYIVERISSSGKTQIKIISSPRERAVTTIGLVSDQVKHSCDADINMDLDERLTGLYHGRFNLPDDYQPGDEFLPDKRAWDIWVDETFNKRNLTYRYGDPVVTEKGVQYPELVGHFLEFGESQTDFSIRIYSFLIDFLKQENEESLQLISSHLAVVLRMAEILSVSNTLDNQFLKTVYLGELPFEEWNHMNKLPNETVSKVVNPIYTLELDLIKLRPYLSMIEVERDYLLALNMQTRSEL